MMQFKFGARDHRPYLETRFFLMAFGDSKMIISQTECTWGPFSGISLQNFVGPEIKENPKNKCVGSS